MRWFALAMCLWLTDPPHDLWLWWKVIKFCLWVVFPLFLLLFLFPWLHLAHVHMFVIKWVPLCRAVHPSPQKRQRWGHLLWQCFTLGTCDSDKFFESLKMRRKENSRDGQQLPMEHLAWNRHTLSPVGLLSRGKWWRQQSMCCKKRTHNASKKLALCITCIFTFQCIATAPFSFHVLQWQGSLESHSHWNSCRLAVGEQPGQKQRWTALKGRRCPRPPELWCFLLNLIENRKCYWSNIIWRFWDRK